MTAYYNEIDLFAAEWLRNLIKKGLIADGEVDTRSIVDVRPDELRAFTQCHFFAGIGGWSHALRLAGWPDDRPIWTGSCPCQPFSVAGKGLGADDPRHLWPHFHRLISALRPPVVMGEQVSGAAGYGWLDGVIADLEREGYAGRAVDIPACAVDAPHIRQRLYWVARDVADAVRCGQQGSRQMGKPIRSAPSADRKTGHVVNAGSGADDTGHMADADGGQSGEGRGDDGEMRRLQEAERQSKYGSALFVGSRQADGDMADGDGLGRPDERLDGIRRPEVHDADGCGERGYMADAANSRCQPVEDAGPADLQSEMAGEAECGQQFGDHNASSLCDMADADHKRCDRLDALLRADAAGWNAEKVYEAAGCGGSFWSNAIWLTGADGKARRAKPDIQLLAHGVPGRVGRLRAYGNAIVPPLAAEVIAAFMECEP